MEISDSSKIVSTKQQRIAELAKQSPNMCFTPLNHHLTLQWLREAFIRVRKDGAVGVDMTTGDAYAGNLDKNLEDLLERLKSGRYRASPVRRVHIPKGKGNETRPLGIPTFEDKLAQRAVCMLLEPIYEQDFMDCSYGFRPGRSAHDCIKALHGTLYSGFGGYVIDVDIRKYFDSIDREKLREIIGKRVGDGVIRRLIGKWLNVGIMENGMLSYAGAGTPQGGVISPLLANVFLHEVLDVWFESMVKPNLSDKAELFRYCDDFVIVCKRRDDALRVMEVLPKRLGKYGLAVHPDKTRLVSFKPPSDGNDIGGAPATFNFLGFTFYWGSSRKGQPTPKVKTAKDRRSCSAGKLWEMCRLMRHWPIIDQWQRLNRILVGHYNYYGVSFNMSELVQMLYLAERAWKFWLSRRSQKGGMTWHRQALILQRYPLAKPRIRVALF